MNTHRWSSLSKPAGREYGPVGPLPPLLPLSASTQPISEPSSTSALMSASLPESAAPSTSEVLFAVRFDKQRIELECRHGDGFGDVRLRNQAAQLGKVAAL